MKSVRKAGLRFGLPLLALSLVALVVPAQEASFSQSLYGNWHTYPLGNPFTDPVRHEFRHNSSTGGDEMVVTRTCAEGTHITVARAVSPVEIKEDTILVLRSSSDSEPLQGAAVCQVNITAAMMSYSFSEDGEHLILTDPGGNPDYLELTRETKAEDTSVPQRLYGTWLLPPIDGKEMQVKVRWVFYTTAERQDRVRQIAICSKGNDSLVSHVDSDISVTKDQIKVLQSASNQQQEGSFICKASILATTWRYAMSSSGLTLTLYAEGAKALTLTREKQAGLN